MASQQMFKSGQARGEGQVCCGTVRRMLQRQRHHRLRAAQSTQQTKELAGGIFQQTGEHVMNMAHNAMDSVKSTLGMGDSNKKF